jgi:Ni,Fe-hydrogenase III component G
MSEGTSPGTLAQEQKVQSDLAQKFPQIASGIRVQRARRVWVDVPLESFRPVMEHLQGPMGFDILCTITGADEGEMLSVMYHLAAASGIVVNLRTRVPKANPVIRTAIDLYPAGEVSERELVDLLGFVVEGLPAGNRYPLPDAWPQGQYPLRKDWTAEALKGTDFAKEDRQ